MITNGFPSCHRIKCKCLANNDNSKRQFSCKNSLLSIKFAVRPKATHYYALLYARSYFSLIFVSLSFCCFLKYWWQASSISSSPPNIFCCTTKMIITAAKYHRAKLYRYSSANVPIGNTVQYRSEMHLTARTLSSDLHGGIKLCPVSSKHFPPS